MVTRQVLRSEPKAIDLRAPERAIWRAVSTYPRIPFDLASYERRTRENAGRGTCFICSIVAGGPEDHLIISRDDVSVSFLATSPTLGLCDPAPLEHCTDVVGDFTEDE
jgi:hypothetical protein